MLIIFCYKNVFRQNKNTTTASSGASGTTSTTDTKLSNLVDFYAPPMKRLFMDSGMNSGPSSNTKVKIYNFMEQPFMFF